MSEWTDLGLPLANRAGYSFTKAFRFERSQYESPLPDQKQLPNPGKKTYTLSWNLTPEQLNVATLYLLEKDFTWFQIELADENGLDLREIRLVDKFDTKPLHSRYYQLSIVVETRLDPISCTPLICDTLEPGDDFPCIPLSITRTIEDDFEISGKVIEGKIHRNLYTVATGIYPVEVDDQMAATAWIVNGWQLAAQIAGFAPDGKLISGEIIQILVPIDFWQEPEAFAPDAQLLSGIIYTTLNPVSFWQDPESFQPDAQLLSGYFTEEAPSVVITNPPEEMTSTAWIVSGTLI